MTEWWKSIQDKLGKATPAQPETLSFRDRMAQERQRQRLAEKKLASHKGASPLAPGESAEAASIQDKRVLVTMLGWKLDLKVDSRKIQGNPALIDGYWFGVKRYWRFGRAEDEEDELSWKLHFYRVCAHCKALVPTIELGDYIEVNEAAKKMMEGHEVLIQKTTSRLATYLNEMEQGRPDPHCPRMCPKCRKLIKGGTV